MLLATTNWSIASILKQVSALEEYFIDLKTLKVTRSSLILRIKFPYWTSIIVLPVARNGLPKMRGTSWSSSMSKTMKSIGKMNLSTLTKTSSTIPLGYVIDLSANYRDTLVGLGSSNPNFLHN